MTAKGRWSLFPGQRERWRPVDLVSNLNRSSTRDPGLAEEYLADLLQRRVPPSLRAFRPAKERSIPRPRAIGKARGTNRCQANSRHQR